MAPRSETDGRGASRCASAAATAHPSRQRVRPRPARPVNSTFILPCGLAGRSCHLLGGITATGWSGGQIGSAAQPSPSSLRANGSRECAPDDGLREAIQKAAREGRITSSLALLAMTGRGLPIPLIRRNLDQAAVGIPAIDRLQRAAGALFLDRAFLDLHAARLEMRDHLVRRV